MAKRKYEFKLGEVIGHWQYLGESKDESGRLLVLKCLECGNIHHVRPYNLTRSRTKMCNTCATKYTSTKHNLSHTRIYSIFKDMHKRCEYEKDYKYPNYGGRGIRVCDDWCDTVEGLKTFFNWAMENGYKDELQLDRIDNDKGYSPDNCRWVTLSHNNFNKRNTKGYRFHQGKWEAYITVNKKMIYLGRYNTEEEAIKARKEGELKYFGENSPNYRGEV